jgi:hypothetical protein
LSQRAAKIKMMRQATRREGDTRPVANMRVFGTQKRRKGAVMRSRLNASSKKANFSWRERSIYRWRSSV